MAYRYFAVPWEFGNILLIWQDDERPFLRLRRLLLPGDPTYTALLFRTIYAGAQPGTDPTIEDLAHDLTQYLQGHPITFPLERLALEDLHPFQQAVLRVDHTIPWGKVVTYKYLAEKTGHPGAARAIGRALSQNPFPILIPCHRVVRTNGALGGFAGGLEMKQRLLSLEGIQFDAKGHVLPNFFLSS